MDTSDNAGNFNAPFVRVRDSDVLRRELADACIAYVRYYRGESIFPESHALATLAEALSQGDLSVADALLRRWGVR